MIFVVICELSLVSYHLSFSLGFIFRIDNTMKVPTVVYLMMSCVLLVVSQDDSEYDDDLTTTANSTAAVDDDIVDNLANIVMSNPWTICLILVVVMVLLLITDYCLRQKRNKQKQQLRKTGRAENDEEGGYDDYEMDWSGKGERREERRKRSRHQDDYYSRRDRRRSRRYWLQYFITWLFKIFICWKLFLWCFMFVNFHNRESALVTDVSRQMFDDAEDDCCQCVRVTIIWSWSRIHQNLLHGPVVTIIDNLV